MYIPTSVIAAFQAYQLKCQSPKEFLPMPKMMIPTIGRKVWYWPDSEKILDTHKDEQPHDATVCFVHSDGRVNLRCTDHNGQTYAERLVHLVDPDSDVRLGGAYATWMPYQIGQAAKDETATKASIAGNIAGANAAAQTAGTVGPVTPASTPVKP